MHERLSFKENEGFGIYLILTSNFVNFNINISCQRRRFCL